MAVLNEQAHQSLNFDVNINDAKAIRDIRNFKREMHDLVRDYNSEATNLKMLGENTRSDETRLEGYRLQIEKLKKTISSLNEQIQNGFGDDASIERQNKIKHMLSGFESELRKAESSEKLLQQRTILFNTELSNLGKVIDTTNRSGERHVQMLQASGRETDALKAKTSNYKGELSLLEKQQKAQLKSLDDYKEAIRKSNNYSKGELDEALKLDVNYQKAKSYSEDTGLRIVKTKNSLDDLTASYQEAQQKAILFNSEQSTLNRTIGDNKKNMEYHVQLLQASGRETDALKAKTNGYQTELGLLEQQQKSQMSSLNDYRETLRKNNNYSQEELDEALKLDTDYQKAKAYYEDINLRFAKVNGTLKNLSSGYEEAKLKSELYSKETSSLTSLIKVQSGTYSANIVELQRLSSQRKIDNQLIEAQKVKMTEIKNAVGENSEAYKKARIEQEKMLASASKNANKEKTLTKSPASYISTSTASKIDKTNKSIDKYNQLANRASQRAHSTTVATLGVGTAFAIGAKNAADLEDHFNKINVLMTTGGENQKEVTQNLNKLRDESRNSSIKYGVSQQKIVEGYQEMTKRGYDSNQVLGAQKYFLQAAIASGDDYNDVVNNGSSALEGFNLKGKSTKETATNTKLAMNQLSYAADLTATDFKSMGYAMGYVASTAHSAHQTIGDTASAIGILSNNGVSASMAGTGLRKVLNSLSSPTNKGVGALASVGLSPADFKDVNGNMLSLQKIMEKINGKTKNLQGVDKLDFFHQLFGATGQESALILSKNTGALAKLNKQVAKSQDQGKDGYIANIADRNMNTAQAQLKRLKEAGTSLASSYAVMILPLVNKVAKKTADFTTGITNASPFVKNIFAGLVSAIPALTALSFASSGFLKAIAGAKSTVNGMRTAFSWLTGNYKKQDSELEQQIQAYKDLTSAIKENTKMKELNSEVDVADDIAGGSGGSSSGGSSSSGTKNGKVKGENLEKEAETIEKDVAKDGKSVSKFGKLGKLGASSGLKSLTSKLGYLGMAVDGISVASDLATGSKDTGKNIGTAVGSGLGMLVPIPGVDIATSMALGYVGGKAGDWVQKNAKVTKKGKPYKPKTFKNGVDSSTADELLSKRPDTSNINDANEFSKAVQEDEARRHGKNKKKQQPVEWADFKKSQNEHGRKFAYDTVGGSDSTFLKKWVVDQNNATMAWATSTSKSSKAVKKSYDKLLVDASSYNDEKNKQEKKNLDTLVKRGIISQDEANNTLQSEKTASQQRLDNVKDTIEKIKNIDLNGGKGRQAELEKLNTQLLEMTDKGSKDQKLILGQLNSDTTRLSREREFELITASKNAKDKTISNATKQYKATVDGAEATYNDTVKKIKGQKQWTEQEKTNAINIAKTQYNQVTSTAQQQKKDTVHWANVQYNKVVQKAQDQANDVSNAIDSVNTSLGDLENGTKGVTGAVSSYVGAISHATPNVEDSLINNHKNITDIASGNVRVKNKTNKEKNSSGFGDFSQLKRYNAFAFGGRSAGEETALMNEDGIESIYNRKKGTFNVVQGKAGLVKLHHGDEVLNADQTKAILDNNLKRGKSTKAYAKGSTGKVIVKLDASGVKTAVSETKKVMAGLNDILEAEYKRAIKQSKKLLSDFRDFSSDNWDKIGDETHKSSVEMTDNTNKDYKLMNSIVSKATKSMKDTVGDDTNSLVTNYDKVMSKLPGYADDSLKKVVANLNKGVTGINTSLKEFGGNTEVLKPIKYATGSNGKLVNDQLAMINDSPTDQRQEAVIRDEKVYLPKGDNRLLKLQTGDQVLNGRQTAKLMKSFGFTRYAGGSGVSDETLKKIAKKNSKNPDKAYNSDFTANVNIDGSDLEESITKAILNGIEPIGKNWTKSMWKLIQNSIDGGGSGSKGAFLKYAEKIGTGQPYVYGGFDCSKLIQDALNHFGIKIGRDTVSQSHSNLLKPLGKNLDDAEVGDLAYFGSSGANAHVGIISDKTNKLMMNQHPDKGGISPIDCGLPLDGYFSVKGLSSNNTPKSESDITKLVQKELGSSALKWISNNLGAKSDGGGVPEATGTHKNWLKEAGIKPSDYGYASEIATKESSWNPHATNGKYYGIAQTTIDNYEKYGGSDWRDNPIGQLATMKAYVDNRYGSFANAISFRRRHDWYENGGLSTKHKMAEISEGNKPEMVIPLTNKSRSVELILKSLEFMFGNSSKVANQKSSNNSDDNKLIKQLIKANEEKDKKIDNILNKMDILISTIQNKPVISEADIYRANKKQTQNQQRFNNLGKGAF